MAYLNGRWARDGLTAEEACRSSLTRGALASISGRVHLQHARNSLRTVGALVSMTIRDAGDMTVISWPKFSEFQGYISGPGAAQGELLTLESPPPHTPPPPHTQKKESVADKAAPSPCRQCGSGHGSRGRAFPEKLSESEANALKTWAEKKQIPIETIHAAARAIREWYDALPIKRARACWVAVIRKAATEQDLKTRKANGSGKPPAHKRASELVFGSREWCEASGIDFETYQREQAEEAARREGTT